MNRLTYFKMLQYSHFQINYENSVVKNFNWLMLMVGEKRLQVLFNSIHVIAKTFKINC